MKKLITCDSVTVSELVILRVGMVSPDSELLLSRSWLMSLDVSNNSRPKKASYFIVLKSELKWNIKYNFIIINLQVLSKYIFKILITEK